MVVVISRWFGPIRTPTILLAGTLGMNLLFIRCFLPWERLAGILLALGDLAGVKTTAYHSWRKRQPELADRHADWLGSGFCKSDGGYGSLAQVQEQP